MTFHTRFLNEVGSGVEWEQGMRLAQACQQQLVNFGLDPKTICCEVLEVGRSRGQSVTSNVQSAHTTASVEGAGSLATSVSNMSVEDNKNMPIPSPSRPTALPMPTAATR
jgi:hypothetical protein